MHTTFGQDGLRFEEVPPGSPSDPFAPGAGADSAPQASPPPAEPAPQETQTDTGGEGGGTAPTPTAEAPPATSGTAPPTPPPEGDAAGAAPAPAAPTPEEEAAALQKLDTFIEEQLDTRAEEIRRKVQSDSDKRVGKLEEETKAAKAQAQALQAQIREFQLNGLSPEDQAKLRAAWEQDDRSTSLDERETALHEYHHALMVATALKDYGAYGVTEEDLKTLTVEEVQLFCAEAKAGYYEELTKQGGTGASGAQPPAMPQAPAQPAPPTTPPAPASVHAPSDVGGGGATPPPAELSEEQTEQAMLDNLRKLPWENIQAP